LNNATAQQDTHPAVHNAANQAINDIVAVIKDDHRTKAWYVQATGTSGPYGNTAGNIPQLTLTVTFEYGRLYRVTAHVPNIRSIDATQANLIIATTAGVPLQTCNQIVEADTDLTMESSFLYGGDGVTHSIVAQLQSTATTMPALYIDGDATHRHFLLVEEINPS
jgi:hypothetical protein